MESEDRHLGTFLARAAGGDGTPGLPAFVRREFEAYLRCGILIVRDSRDAAW